MDIQAEPVTNETAGEQEMDEFQEVDMQPSVIRTALDLYNLVSFCVFLLAFMSRAVPE